MTKVTSQVDYKFTIELNDKEALALHELIVDHGGGMNGEFSVLYDALFVELSYHGLL